MHRGLSWVWNCLPSLRFSPVAVKVAASIQNHMDEMLVGVAEDALSWVFLSCPIVVPKQGSPKDGLMVDLSTLNRFVTTRKFEMMTMALVQLHL